MKKQKEKLLPYCSICKTEYSCKEYETGIAHQDKQTPHKQKCKHLNCLVYHPDGICNCDMARYCGICTPPTPKQDKPQKKRNIYQKLGIKQLFGMKIIETKYQPPQKEIDKIEKAIKEGFEESEEFLKTNPSYKLPQKEGCKNDTYTYEETLETVKKLSKFMQKEGWEKELNKWYGLMFECGDYEALVDFIRKLLASQRQEINNSWLHQKANEHDKRIREDERQKVEEMIPVEEIERITAQLGVSVYGLSWESQGKRDYEVLKKFLSKLRTKEGDIKS